MPVPGFSLPQPFFQETEKGNTDEFVLHEAPLRFRKVFKEIFPNRPDRLQIRFI